MRINLRITLLSLLCVLVSCSFFWKHADSRVGKEELNLNQIAGIIASDIEKECNCRAVVRDTTELQYNPLFENTQSIEEKIGEKKYLSLLKSYLDANKQSLPIMYKSRSTSTDFVNLNFSNYGVSSEGDMLMIYVGKVYGPLDGSGRINIYRIERKDGIVDLIEMYTIKLWVS